MTPAKFAIGQKVRIRTAVPALRRELGPGQPCEGTVLDIRIVGGRRLYQVGGRINDDPDALWNAEFREHELAEAG